MNASEARRSRALIVGIWIIAPVAAMWWLRAAAPLLVPIVLAICISYALEPVVAWMARVMPRLAATTLLMVCLLGLCGWGLYTLRDDAAQAIEALPDAARRVRVMVTSQGKSGPGASLRDAAQEINGITSGGAQRTQGSEGAAPSAMPAGSSLVQRGVGSLFTWAGNVVTIVFLVFFLLAAGDHFGRRVMEIAGNRENRDAAGQIVRDINRQIQRFLLVRLVTGVFVGLATWGALVWLDTPQAPVWAILAGVFNSIPYFGPVIVSGGLFAVGIVQSGDAVQALKMAGAALAITSLEGWLITPPLLGKAERMSAVVVFIGLLVWTWMWGAWGTLLAVPMLVVLKSVADHVDALRPVSRLMAP